MVETEKYLYTMICSLFILLQSVAKVRQDFRDGLIPRMMVERGRGKAGHCKLYSQGFNLREDILPVTQMIKVLKNYVVLLILLNSLSCYPKEIQKVAWIPQTRTKSIQ